MFLSIIVCDLVSLILTTNKDVESWIIYVFINMSKNGIIFVQHPRQS